MLFNLAGSRLPGWSLTTAIQTLNFDVRLGAGLLPDGFVPWWIFATASLPIQLSGFPVFKYNYT